MAGIIVFYVVSPVHIRNVHLFAPQLGEWKLRIAYEAAAPWFTADEIRDWPFETIALRIGDVPDELWQGEVKAIVFASVQPRPVPVEMLIGAMQRGIPTIAIEESNQMALNQGRVNNYILPVDQVLTASMFERRAMIREGFPAHRLTASGWPFYEGRIGRVPDEEKWARKKALGLDPGRPTAALTLTAVHHADENAAVRRDLLTLAAEGLPDEYQLVVKPHPIESLDTVVPFIRECAPRALAIDGKLPSAELLEATDVLLNRGASQVCLEALLQEIPVIILDTGTNTLFHGLTEELIVKDPSGLRKALGIVKEDGNFPRVYGAFFSEHIHVSPEKARKAAIEKIISMIRGGACVDFRGEQWFDIALFQAWLGDLEDACENAGRIEAQDRDCPTDEFVRLAQCKASRGDLDGLKGYFGEGFRAHFLRCLWIRQLLICKDTPTVGDLEWMETFPPDIHTVWFVKTARDWIFHLANTGNREAAIKFADLVHRRHRQMSEVLELVNDVEGYLSGPIGRAKVLMKSGFINLLRPIGRKIADWGLLNFFGIRK
jgi:hypothetical protein